MSITLSEAIKQNRLEEFSSQEEAREIGPIDRADFNAALGKMVKAPQSKSNIAFRISRWFERN